MTVISTSKDILNKLFPAPVAPAKHLAPENLPGVSVDTSDTLSRLLKDDHERHHIFFNAKGFHKCVLIQLPICFCRLIYKILSHATHHLYAIYTLGASSEVLEAAYQTHVKYQRPSFDSPTDITESNWISHLGDELYVKYE